MPPTANQKARVLAEALPFIRAFHATTLVIRFGGAAMTDPALKEGFARDVALLRLVGMKPIVVHGGGWRIDGLLQKMGIEVRRHRGIRMTDAATMNVVEMVLGELNQDRRPHQPARGQGSGPERTGWPLHPCATAGGALRCRLGRAAGPGLRRVGRAHRALKIPGEGVRRRGRPGYLLVRVKIRIPKQLTPEMKELYEKILELEGSSSSPEKKGFFSGLMGKK